MYIFTLSFLFGVVLLQQLMMLPSLYWTGIAVLILLIARWIPSSFKSLILGSILGFFWALWFAHSQMSWTLPDAQEGKNILISGYITSIPNVTELGSSFLFKTNKATFHLTWKDSPQTLNAGDQWKLTVRLKKIHGTRNPGSFDYEAYALEEGIRANGYVVGKAENTLLQSYFFQCPLLRIRQWLKEKIEKNLPVSNTSPWIVALVVGERHNIRQENWQVLRNTGTNHLMAIAGLHIGLMSGFIYILVNWSWRRFPYLALRMPAQIAGAMSALVMALIYSALSGFSIPTQRACLMLSLFLLMAFFRRTANAWYAWHIALLLMLCINPLTVLSESFWLSFGSVALIIYGMSGRLSPKGLWWKWGRIQWVIAFGLIPFSIWLFQQYSLVSFVANSIAIPWVGFLIVPLSLLGSASLLFSEKLGGFLLVFADKLLGILWNLLSWFSHLSWASLYQVMPNIWTLIAATIGIVLLLIPKGFPGRYFGIIGLLPMFLYQPEKPTFSEIWFTLLDVGQGLSAVVQTQHHILVFDAGPKLGASFDMGESVVIPFLHTIGAKKIDMLVVSHPHNDHEGGVNALLNHFSNIEIKASAPEKFPKNSSYCLRGQKWTWDGVHFEFLYPTLKNLALDNDSSCVLKIVSKNHSLLLTGDIEKFSEKFLVAGGNLTSDILVAPHHGSKTSAQDDFVQAVSPKYVLYAVGYRNRYRFPNVSVVEKYRNLGVVQFDTASAGAIQFGKTISLYRKEHERYWNYAGKNSTFLR